MTGVYGIRVQVRRRALGPGPETQPARRGGRRRGGPHARPPSRTRESASLRARVHRDSLHSPVRLSAGSTVESMKRITVLFVDDDDFIRGAYGDLLRDEGFSVVEAA